MVKHIPTTPIFPDKFCQCAHQTQLCSLLSPRHHFSQLLAQVFFIAKHKTSNPIQHKHCYCHKRKHSCPRLYTGDACFDKAKQSFRIAESFLAAKPPRIFLSRLLGTHLLIAQKVPDAPFAFSISLAALSHIKASWVFLAVTQPPTRAPSLVARQSKIFELDPLAVEINLDVVFGANDERDSQFIEQIHQFDISKCAIRSQKQTTSGNRMKHFIKECAHEVAFITATAIFKRVLVVCPPVQRYCARADAKRSNKKMLLIFNRPVNAEANCADQGKLRDDDTRSLARQRINIKTQIVQKASQSSGSGFKVVKETSETCLTATSGRNKRQYKIDNGVTLMAVRVFKDRVDILNEASWGRDLSGHNPILYRVNNSFHSPH